VAQPVWTGNLTDGNGSVSNATGSALNGYLSFDDPHPTAAGHALVAAVLTQNFAGTA
jgi:hypothetical protein